MISSRFFGPSTSSMVPIDSYRIRTFHTRLIFHACWCEKHIIRSAICIKLFNGYDRFFFCLHFVRNLYVVTPKRILVYLWCYSLCDLLRFSWIIQYLMDLKHICLPIAPTAQCRRRRENCFVKIKIEYFAEMVNGMSINWKKAIVRGEKISCSLPMREFVTNFSIVIFSCLVLISPCWNTCCVESDEAAERESKAINFVCT